MIVVPRSRFTALLPLPPSTNNLFVTARGGTRVKSAAYRGWLAAVAPELLQVRKPERLPAEIRVIVFGAVNRARDLDNMLKPIGDALVAAGVIPGDSLAHVTGWRITYGGPWDAPEPRALVEVVPGDQS